MTLNELVATFDADCASKDIRFARDAYKDDIRAYIEARFGPLMREAKALDETCEEFDGYDNCKPMPERTAVREALARAKEE